MRARTCCLPRPDRPRYGGAEGCGTCRVRRRWPRGGRHGGVARCEPQVVRCKHLAQAHTRLHINTEACKQLTQGRGIDALLEVLCRSDDNTVAGGTLCWGSKSAEVTESRVTVGRRQTLFLLPTARGTRRRAAYQPMSGTRMPVHRASCWPLACAQDYGYLSHRLGTPPARGHPPAHLKSESHSVVAGGQRQHLARPHSDGARQPVHSRLRFSTWTA